MREPISRGASIAVCVPIRNEAALLPRFLDALAGQGAQHQFVLCALFDACTDDSVAIVEQRAGMLPFAIVVSTIGTGPPNAGLARRRAMEIGLSALGEGGGIIVSTDADSVPASNWLAANAAALAIADVAAGRIERGGGRASPEQDRLEAYYDALFELRRAIDPVPWEADRTHHCASAASLAFRAGSYRALGGFDPVTSGEDGRIVDRAHRQGMRVRRDAAIHVRTSARRKGRAVGGLADHLLALDAVEAPAMVCHPDDEAWRYARQAMARAAWADLSIDRVALADAIGCEVAHVDRVAREAPNAEAFATRVVPDVPGGGRFLFLDHAETALARLRAGRQALAA